MSTSEVDVRGDVVLVTGASRGIGRAIAQRFAAAGARVTVAYRGARGEAEATLSTLAGDGHRLAAGDLADPEACRRLVEEVIAVAGRLDVLVNNAGVFSEHRLLEASWEEWQRAWQTTLAVNLAAPAQLCYWAARAMARQGGGRIVNVSSRGAFRGEPDAPAYGASKAGLNALSQSLAKALAPHGVLVYAVAPGWVDTEMAAGPLAAADGAAIRAQSPFGRVATPDEVAQVVLLLAGSRNAFLSGCIVDVNGASYLRT